MINVKHHEDCCGCNACGDACPQRAIQFKSDKEGFLYPVVDFNKCVNCSLCEKACPVLHVQELRGTSAATKPKAVAAFAKDLEIRFDSTSGGVFSILAQKTLDAGGFVGGAVWHGASVIQVVTDKADDLPALRSSKYAQSDARGFYVGIKSALDTGRPVLVCGTPCQMVALRCFLGKDYSNLIVVDFVCRGINSPLIMEKYIEMFGRKHHSRVVAVKQKSKELGWHRLTTKFTFENDEVAYDPRETSLFMRGYLYSNMFCRPSCYSCHFKGFPRLADISLADCWGAVDSLKGMFNADLGTSLVLLNSSRGERYFDEVQTKLETAEIDHERMLDGNKALTMPLPRPNADRAAFFAAIRSVPFEQAMKYVVEGCTGRESLVRRALSVLKRIVRLNVSIFHLLKYNKLRTVLRGEGVLRTIGRTVIEKECNASLRVLKTTIIGGGIFKHTQLESRVLLQAGSELILHGGAINYGCDIELFRGARLEIGASFYANIGATIICEEDIRIGDYVMFGRNVSIRDTNGGHFVNSADYVNAAPVVVGDHVWLCEGVKIMPGVKIGSGSIVAAGAVVTKDIPPNTLVAGVPARVIRRGVQWKA